MNKENKELKVYFRNIFGFRVRHLEVFKTALIHRSASDTNAVCGRLNNERLEYLGDAVLGSVVADFLFHKYPLESEGVLTRMRSKLVNRSRLNALARKLGLHEMMHIDGNVNSVAANGNAFEAIVGAIYLDQGYKNTYRILIHNVYRTHLDIDAIFQEEDDYKSRILIWGQKNHHQITFDNVPTQEETEKMYRSSICIDGAVVAQGLGFSVKKAEQTASEKAWIKLPEENSQNI